MTENRIYSLWSAVQTCGRAAIAWCLDVSGWKAYDIRWEIIICHRGDVAKQASHTPVASARREI